uniref:Reverse transcriptase domain-containing protein n=1 Tax=Fagus sylvatica TaxID=28930 RepID=A0A2N9IY01_FAGSY
MGDRRSFRIESKRFDLVRENDGTKQVRISEKGFYHQSIVYMGKEGVQWLGRCMDENIVREGERAFTRTLREHGKTFIIRRYSNKFGRYIEVLECGMGGSRERIVIPEGQQHNGWKGFNKELRILVNFETKSNNQQAQWGAGRVEGAEVGKNLRQNNGPLKSYRDAVSVGNRETEKIEKLQNCEAKHTEPEKEMDPVVGAEPIGLGPRSTYEVGESSRSTKQQNGMEKGLSDKLGLESTNNKARLTVVVGGPSKMAYPTHGLSRFYLKESNALIIGQGAYQIHVDWHFVEEIIPTNRGRVSKVPVKLRIACDFLSHRFVRHIDKENILIEMGRLVRGAEKMTPTPDAAFAREAEELQHPVTFQDTLAMVPSLNMNLAREPREDTDVLDISPIFEVQTCVKGQYSISCTFKNSQDQLEWTFSGVYGPNVDADRGLLWEELAGFHSWWGVLWCIGGDFNVVRFPNEKLGAGRHTGAMQIFFEFIFELGLVDLPLMEGQFTWSNNQDLPAKSCIDRFLVSTDWEEQFSHLKQKALPRFVSDHCPIMLECGSFKRGKSYFKFENMWLQHQDFVGNVRNWWGGDVRIKKLELMQELQMLEGKKDQGLLTAEEKSNRLNTQAKLEKTLLLDEVSWRQKSRVQWLKEGDKNTKFFQRTANANRRNNYIESLQHGDQQWKSETKIRDGIVNFYQGLYSEKEAWRLMGGDKALGSDGYIIAFYKHCWDIVKVEVLNSLQEFHEQESIKRSLNATFVVLIPNKPGVSDVKDFRPICLIGSVYKILSKTCCVLRLKAGIPGLLCKLDVEKAYDHVNWNFLLYMLERCGFGAKWRNWMYFCISTVQYSILINGTPCGFFNSTRGIRQGDSLSPLLFVLVMEALSRLMDKAVAENLLEGFAVNNHNRPYLKISHLLFADDTLIFCGATRDQLLHLKRVLMCFEAVSGLHINLGKSEIVPVRTVQRIHELAQVIGGRITTLPMKYLGLPLGA